jgi:uncharacterized protein YjbI with pentapeptide repeats
LGGAKLSYARNGEAPSVFSIDLTSADLTNANLIYADLNHARLSDAKLARSNETLRFDT